VMAAEGRLFFEMYFVCVVRVSELAALVVGDRWSKFYPAPSNVSTRA
jgi:hypothetical protein